MKSRAELCEELATCVEYVCEKRCAGEVSEAERGQFVVLALKWVLGLYSIQPTNTILNHFDGGSRSLFDLAKGSERSQERGEVEVLRSVVDAQVIQVAYLKDAICAEQSEDEEYFKTRAQMLELGIDTLRWVVDFGITTDAPSKSILRIGVEVPAKK